LRAAREEAVLGLGLRITSIMRLGLGDHDLAVSESGEALTISRRLGDRNRLCADLIFHAQALCQAGRLEETARLLDEAEALDGLTDSSARGARATVRGDWGVAVGDWALAACFREGPSVGPPGLGVGYGTAP
jgi:hypothetical protein